MQFCKAPVAQRFSLELFSQLSRLFEDRKIALGFPIQHRVKTWDSIAEKLRRFNLPLESLLDLQDLVGLRVILLFSPDVSQVQELIEEKFDVIKSYHTRERLGEDQFGYSSVHFVIQLPSEWLAVPTLASFERFRAEVRVRTVAQHIWAAASHVLQYKQESGVPLTVRRSIYRVSALLETVDLEFERVLRERASYRRGVDVAEEDDLLNVDLLEKVLDSQLPKRNKHYGEKYADLLGDLQHFGIRSAGQLTDLLKKRMEVVRKIESERVRREMEAIRRAGEDIEWRWKTREALYSSILRISERPE